MRSFLYKESENTNLIFLYIPVSHGVLQKLKHRDLKFSVNRSIKVSNLRYMQGKGIDGNIQHVDVSSIVKQKNYSFTTNHNSRVISEHTNLIFIYVHVTCMDACKN
jgi:hypothetical protein